jgi:predicted NAD/FAD-binding protein
MCKGEVPVSSNGTKVPVNGDSPRRVAVIGGGVAGLSAAWHLAENCPNVQVELFEAENRLGGHAYTVPVENADGSGKTNVDIGFMVFNESNYPNMIRWFEQLGVPNENTDMSLSVSLDKGETVEWNSDGINGLLARRGQAMDPQFYIMLYDMHRFNKEAAELLLLAEDDPRKAVTTGQYLRAHGYSQAFGTYYLLPMMAALWSASMEDVLAFPAVQLISFLCNHKMLQLLDRPQVSFANWKNKIAFTCFFLVSHIRCLLHTVVENRSWPVPDVYYQGSTNPR